MHNIKDIRNIQLEPSSFCNARCPKCVRNYAGTDLNTGYGGAEKVLIKL
jgi:hypothetical protein